MLALALHPEGHQSRPHQPGRSPAALHNPTRQKAQRLAGSGRRSSSLVLQNLTNSQARQGFCSATPLLPLALPALCRLPQLGDVIQYAHQSDAGELEVVEGRVMERSPLTWGSALDVRCR